LVSFKTNVGEERHAVFDLDQAAAGRDELRTSLHDPPILAPMRALTQINAGGGAKQILPHSTIF
jgi:hypothetical protein